MKLTDAKLRALKATGKTTRISDGAGLFIELTPKGSRLWRLAYRFEGKQKLLALGSYPEVSLMLARQKCEEAKRMLASWIDPSAEKQRIRKEQKTKAEKERFTFRTVAMEWIEFQKETWAASNLKKKLLLLDILFQSLGDKPVGDVAPADILAVLRPVEAAGKVVTAHALAQTANQICRFARACGYCLYNAADGLTCVLRPIESRHYACLTSPYDVGRLMRAIDA